MSRRKENLRKFDWLITLIGVILAGIIVSMVQSLSNTDKEILALALAFSLYAVYNESKRRSKR